MISRGIILVTFLGVSIPLFSQTHAVDSMRRLVATLSDPFLKMEQYYRIGANLYEVDFDKGSLYADSAHSVALQLNRKDWLWKTYVLKALMIDDPGRRDEAIGFHEQGLKVVREIGFEEGIRIQLVNLGGMYQEKGDLNKALDYYRQARQTLTIDSTPKLKETRITLHKNIGQILKDKNQLEEAVKEYLEGVSLVKNTV
ncbi:MAG: tetratricopeptide repeat protein [Saprospiraceae bacterium]|nr:tetratricopeptide repeat protein [Saprospiraceae bacterium]